MKNLQNITFSFKLSKNVFNYVLFWIIYLLSALQWIWILKRFFCDTWSRVWKTRSESREINNPPYVENNYRIEVKITFLLIADLVLLCEFFWEFSIFHFCRPLVDIYWHPLLMFHLKTFKKYDFFFRYLEAGKKTNKLWNTCFVPFVIAELDHNVLKQHPH